MTAPALALEVNNLRKRYGATRALDGLDLAVHRGETVGIAGPNGAGKSTLIKVLAGEVWADSGSILVAGQIWNARIGTNQIAVVHQEAQLFPNLTITENLLVGREHSRLRWRGTDAKDREVMDSLGLAPYANVPLGQVPLAAQQCTEIARALVRDARLFLFDEPNSALTDEESRDLFVRMKALVTAGHGVVLVSHRLQDLVEHCDRVIIVRDGRAVTELRGAALVAEAIAAQLAAGHSGHERRSRESRSSGQAAMTLRGWSDRGGTFTDIDLEIAGGSVLAVTGVEGSGARELARSLVGLRHATGWIEMFGINGTKSFAQTEYVSPDRQASLFTNLSIAENITARLGPEIVSRFGFVSRRQIRNLSTRARTETAMKAPDLSAPIRSLSGGNQQKVAISAGLASQPKVLVLEEPTRGVDVTSKQEIYELIRTFTAAGNIALTFCTEPSEVYDLADSVVVVSHGSVAGRFDVASARNPEQLAQRISSLESVAPTVVGS